MATRVGDMLPTLLESVSPLYEYRGYPILSNHETRESHNSLIGRVKKRLYLQLLRQYTEVHKATRRALPEKCERTQHMVNGRGTKTADSRTEDCNV
ncbi:unnamed protein product [Periconia digitata]|uniref:Uncharacterized protein n=1 Tax=Periconia digitata TaxID=1303443 RepID=A0A9W4XNU0_9PLEO|nr:unnamed protein product [Periconia digitata]